MSIPAAVVVQSQKPLQLKIKQVTQTQQPPRRAILIKPINQNSPQHHFTCDCQMCVHYQAKKISQLLDKRTQKVKEKISMRMTSQFNVSKRKHYRWILRHLLVPHNKIIGRNLDIYVAQIVFFENGEAHSLFCSKEIDDPVVKRVHKEKLNNNLIQKILNDRRRKYKEHIKDYLGKKKKIVQKPKFGVQKKKQTRRDFKGAVVIKYLEGSQQLITETQFINVLQKRKQDPIWRQIQYIKNYISVAKAESQNVIGRYNHQDIKYMKLFERAKSIVKICALNIHSGQKGFIQQKQQVEFCLALQKQSLLTFATYCLYKIVSYVQAFYDQRILEIVAKFLVNEQGKAYLQGVYKLESKSLIKYDWTNQIYVRKIKEQEHRVFFSKSVSATQPINRNAQKLQKSMNQIYENLRDHYGLSLEQEDDQQQINNNQFFHYLHPEIGQDISQILKDKGMSTKKFQKDYLGYKPTKKPIVRPHTSNMIKVLHQTTPKFQKAIAHNYLSTPKRTTSTAFTSRARTRCNSVYGNRGHTSFTNSPGVQ